MTMGGAAAKLSSGLITIGSVFISSVDDDSSDDVGDTGGNIETAEEEREAVDGVNMRCSSRCCSATSADR